MAAEEEQREGVVVIRARGTAGHVEYRVHFLPASPRALTAPLVGQPPLGDRDKPRQRAVGSAFSRPLQGGREQRFLHGVLAGIELSVAPHERAEGLRRQLAQQALDVPRARQTSGAVPSGRTSTTCDHSTICPAISRIRASFSTSSTQ